MGTKLSVLFNGFCILTHYCHHAQDVAKGKKTDISLIFLNNINEEIADISFDVIADDFARLRVTDSFRLLPELGQMNVSEASNETCISEEDIGNTIVHDTYIIKSEGVNAIYQKSYSRSICEESLDSTPSNTKVEWKRYFFPFVTVVFDVDGGQLKRIVFDEGCFTCLDNSQECQRNAVAFFEDNLENTTLGFNCGVSEAECKEDPLTCDLVIYLVWNGFDLDGNVLQTFSRRISLFLQYSIEELTNFLAI